MNLPSVNTFLVLTTFDQYPGTTVTGLRECLDDLQIAIPRHSANMLVMRLVESGSLKELPDTYPKQYTLTIKGRRQLKQDFKFFKKVYKYYLESQK